MIATEQDGRWLVFRAAVSATPDGSTPWDLLRANAGLPGPAKIVLPGGRGPAEARAELRIEERDRPDRITRAIHAVRIAAAALGADEPIAERAADPVDWLDLLERIGWPGREKGPER
ncbi:MAG: hypothetical protein GF346_11120, partial [Candidatus Eisenbacteria bacterium]|nr:hypothetical protein [Candidatus Latescibacterota bacterium]MBD3302986.1 hypothetical protein [Candidatus Eisenbacteria bacterium]